MPGNKEFTPITSHSHINPRLIRLSYQSQLFYFQNILTVYFGMTAMWYKKLIIKTTEYGQSLYIDMMTENTKHFLFQRIFGNSIEMIKPGLSRPTNIKS